MNNNSNNDLSIINLKPILFSFKSVKNKCTYSFKKVCLILLISLIFVVNCYIVFKLYTNKKYAYSERIKKYIHINNDSLINKSNIDYTDEFFKLKEVQFQIRKKNLTYVDTISGGYGKVGNALIMLNNLLNICINIKCANVISPGGLQNLIKKPVFYKDYNITIFPNSFKINPKFGIELSKKTTFWFGYKNKPHLTRFGIIRDEVINNLPKINTNENELYIHIRSGDIFTKSINKMYSQPPLCFYQKVINENNYSHIYILSNGNENPVFVKLLEIYPKMKYIHGTIEYDMSIIINAINFIMSISTFAMTLIHLNTKLKNLYIYELLKYNKNNADYTIHIMRPSDKYRMVMERKWRKTKEQLYLMLNENCIKSKFDVFTCKSKSN